MPLEPEIQIALMAEYMRAAIRAQNPRDLHAWSTSELRGVFCLVQSPAIGFEQWCATMYPGAPRIETAAAAVDETGLTEDQKAANDRFIEYLEKWRKEQWSTE